MADIDQRPAFQNQVTSMVRGGGLDVEVVPAGDLTTEEMILNIGPQHPSTHGVLRVVLELDGEVITRAEPVIGYMHRAAEKLAEFRDTRQTLVLMNRHDWISAFNNELGFVIAVERLADIEVPDRAQWIRTMFAEWNRILNHLMFSGSYPLELGAMTPLFYAFREREMIQDLMESATGARMHHSYCRVGGLKDDLPRGFLKQSAVVLAAVRKSIQRLRDPDHGQRDHLQAVPQRRDHPDRDGGAVRDIGSGAAGVRRRDGPAQGRALREVRRGRVRGPGRADRRLVRPPVDPRRAHEAVAATSSSSAWTSSLPARSGRRSCRRR